MLEFLVTKQASLKIVS